MSVQYKPEEDGFTHIRIDGQTEIGIQLADWQHYPFKDPVSKESFQCLRAFKLWLFIQMIPKYQSKNRLEDLSKLLSVFEQDAVQFTDSIWRTLPDGIQSEIQLDEYHQRIEKATLAQYQKYGELIDALIKRYQPFAYYQYNTAQAQAHRLEPEWVETLERMRYMASFENARLTLYRLINDGEIYQTFVDTGHKPAYRIRPFQDWLNRFQADPSKHDILAQSFLALGFVNEIDPPKKILDRCFFGPLQYDQLGQIEFQCCQENGYLLKA